MSAHNDVVLAYFEGFRHSDHAAILALLTDDVVWDLYGHRHLTGKQQCDEEIENEGFDGSPELTVDRLIEDGDLISRVESYVVPTESDAASDWRQSYSTRRSISVLLVTVAG